MKNVKFMLFVIVFTIANYSLANEAGTLTSNFVSYIECPKTEEGPIRKGGEVIVVIGKEVTLALRVPDCANQTTLSESPKKSLKVYANGQLIVERAFEGNSTTMDLPSLVPQQLQIVLEVGSCQSETSVSLMPKK